MEALHPAAGAAHAASALALVLGLQQQQQPALDTPALALSPAACAFGLCCCACCGRVHPAAVWLGPLLHLPLQVTQQGLAPGFHWGRRRVWLASVEAAAWGGAGSTGGGGGACWGPSGAAQA